MNGNLNKYWLVNRKINRLNSENYMINNCSREISNIHNENEWRMDNHYLAPLKFHNFEDFTGDCNWEDIVLNSMDEDEDDDD